MKNETDTSIRISKETSELLKRAARQLKGKTGVAPKSNDQLVQVALREYMHMLTETPADQIAK
jgi:hypothetical protein